MTTDLEQLDKRYSLQTKWSKPLREYIYQKLPSDKSLRILETGSGTGSVIRSITEEIPDRIRMIAGIDHEPGLADFSSVNLNGLFCTGKGEYLPFPCNSFDFVYCHYLLLWVSDPVAVLKEMRRVTVHGGICAALAEPCYADMEARPESLHDLAVLQRKNLIFRGINPEAGAELGGFFRLAGFGNAEFGKYKKCSMSNEYIKTEIKQMAEDIPGNMEIPEPDPTFEFNIPTYYAIAFKE